MYMYTGMYVYIYKSYVCVYVHTQIFIVQRNSMQNDAKGLIKEYQK